MIESSYLESIATKIETDADNVLINDSILISTFELEKVTGSTYEVKFGVLAVDTTQINNIKLRKADNSVISSNDVTIPIASTEAIIRQIITVSEVTT